MKILIRQRPGEPWAMVESVSYTTEAEVQRLLDLAAWEPQETV